MSTLYFIAAVVYLSMAYLKTYFLLKVYPRAVAGIVRAHWRAVGTAEDGYFAKVAAYTALAFTIVAMFWPILILVEGRKVVRPYNAFGVMRSCMRAVQTSHGK